MFLLELLSAVPRFQNRTIVIIKLKQEKTSVRRAGVGEIRVRCCARELAAKAQLALKQHTLAFFYLTIGEVSRLKEVCCDLDSLGNKSDNCSCNLILTC